MNRIKQIKQTAKSLYPDGYAWQGKEEGEMSYHTDALAEVSSEIARQADDMYDAFSPATSVELEEKNIEYGTNYGYDSEDDIAKNLFRWTPRDCTFDTINEMYQTYNFDVIARPVRAGEDLSKYFEITVGDGIFGIGIFGNAIFGDAVVEEPPILTNARIKKTVIDYNIIYGNNVFGAGIFGDYSGYKEIDYNQAKIPINDKYWSLIYIVESPTGEAARIPGYRKEEFIDISIKCKPLFMWVLVLAEFA